jgi:FRG domain-containing protein
MPGTTNRLSREEMKRFLNAPVVCPKLAYKVGSLADYFAVISSAVTKDELFWFRGHARTSWKLVPMALRYKSKAERERALALISEFKRVAEIKLPRPPQYDEELKWIQIARHFGLPTRLLDWTESATAALFFACEDSECDGFVFVLNPTELNRLSYSQKPRILDANLDRKEIDRYLKLDAKYRAAGKNPIAINPVWNSERLILQRGVFTLHGSKFDLSGKEIPSLVALPILKQSKSGLRAELGRIGVDEMNIFPELEHSCRHLKHRAGLEF